MAFVKDGDAGGVVAAVFEAAKPCHHYVYRVASPDIADNAAHGGLM
jgi:hypothetical protein